MQPSPAGRSPVKFQLFYLPTLCGWLGQCRGQDLGDHRPISLARPSQYAPWPKQVQRTAEQRSSWKADGRTCILRTYASCLCNKACPTSVHNQSKSGLKDEDLYDGPAVRTRRLSNFALTANHALVYSLFSALHSHPGR